MLHRKEQIESTLHRAISQVLVRQLSDPRIAGLVGVTRVKVSQDMRNADVFVSVVPDKYEKRTLAGLRAAEKYVHEQASKLLSMRSVPHIHFSLDAELKKQEEIYDAIAKGLDREGIDATQVEHETEGKPVGEEDETDGDDEVGFDNEADDADHVDDADGDEPVQEEETRREV